MNQIHLTHTHKKKPYTFERNVDTSAHVGYIKNTSTLWNERMADYVINLIHYTPVNLKLDRDSIQTDVYTAN